MKTHTLLAKNSSLPVVRFDETFVFTGYSNETEFYAGALAYLRYRPAHFDRLTSKNIFYISTIYSQKKQFNFLFQPTIYFQDGLYRSFSELQYKKWPSEFYGIGMNSNRDISEKYTSEEIKLKSDLTRIVSDNWELAFCYEFVNHQLVKLEDNKLLASGNIPGSQNSSTSGAGLKVTLNSSNSESYPTKGSIYSLQIMNYSKHIGSDYKFSSITLDLRKYFEIDNQNILAVQSYFSSINGDVPFHQLNYMNDNMRAITSNLFIDQNVYVFRMEDRFFHWNDGFKKRLGLVIFAELGEVASEIAKFNLEQFQFNYGLGFRYSFFLDDRMNARLDIGFGEVKASISMATGEVF